MRRGIVVPWSVLWLLLGASMLATVAAGRVELVRLGLETVRFAHLLGTGGARSIGSSVTSG